MPIVVDFVLFGEWVQFRLLFRIVNWLRLLDADGSEREREWECWSCLHRVHSTVNIHKLWKSLNWIVSLLLWAMKINKQAGKQAKTLIQPVEEEDYILCELKIVHSLSISICHTEHTQHTYPCISGYSSWIFLNYLSISNIRISSDRFGVCMCAWAELTQTVWFHSECM